VIIVDDDPSVLRSLSRLVRQAGYAAHTYGSAAQYLAAAAGITGPRCLVLDLSMPEMGGLELQRRLAGAVESCPVIFISGNGTISATVEAMKQGALTLLAKPFDPSDLLIAIVEGIARHRDELANRDQLVELRERIATLTDREREVMAWVITGALNKQTAAHLGIVEKTVKVHRARVMEKMAAISLAELVRLCDAAGFVPAVAAGID
jgi:FixJ family two-component response regulator